MRPRLLLVVHVSFANGFNVSYRQGQTYISEEQLYLNTRGGVPFRTTTAKTDPKTGRVYYPPNLVPPSSLASTAILYAQLVNGDLLKPVLRKLPGTFFAYPIATRANTPINLPFVAIDGYGATPKAAIEVANRVSNAFRAYVAANQREQNVPAQQRVLLAVTTQAKSASVFKSRHFTVPIIVFLVTIIATLGLAFLLENLRPRQVLARDRSSFDADTEPTPAPAAPFRPRPQRRSRTRQTDKRKWSSRRTVGEPRVTRRPGSSQWPSEPSLGAKRGPALR